MSFVQILIENNEMSFQHYKSIQNRIFSLQILHRNQQICEISSDCFHEHVKS